MRARAVAVALLVACGGGEPFRAPRVDTFLDGPIGSPSTDEGCRRDFCPTAWPHQVTLQVHELGWRFCACRCTEPDAQNPGGRVMWWTRLPWPREDLAWAQQQWSKYCPFP